MDLNMVICSGPTLTLECIKGVIDSILGVVKLNDFLFVAIEIEEVDDLNLNLNLINIYKKTY